MKDKIFFYSEKEQYGEFSNFASYPVKLAGKLWPTSEHNFQAQKFEDNQYQELIRKASSPLKATELGRSRKMKIRKNWNNKKDQIMFEIVLAKFSQHEGLKALLLQTEEAEIIEHTENDDYWGDGGNGKGKNKLGKILMKVRELLKKQKKWQSNLK